MFSGGVFSLHLFFSYSSFLSLFLSLTLPFSHSSFLSLKKEEKSSFFSIRICPLVSIFFIFSKLFLRKAFHFLTRKTNSSNTGILEKEKGERERDREREREREERKRERMKMERHFKMIVYKKRLGVKCNS